MLKVNEYLPLPTVEHILRYISDYQIFNHYFPDYNFIGNTCSPLRGDDDIPSFKIFYSEKYSKLIFYDFATKDKGDCFVFVSRLTGLDYFSTLCKICRDFNIPGVSYPGYSPSIIKKKVKRVNIDYSTVNKKISIKVKTKPYTKEELEWWNSFGISSETLRKYNVFSLSKIFINSWIIESDFSFGYLEFKDNQYTWKIYSPFSKDNKWINNANHSVIQGWSQLPDKGEVLILTKALKDTMSIVQNTGYSSCSLQSETSSIKGNVLEQLKQRFPYLYFLFDNDDPGIKHGTELSKKYNIPLLTIPHPKFKDFSDLYKGVGKDYSIKILNKIITNKKQ